MTFADSTSTCLRKYFVFEGRASKEEFWFFLLFTVIYGFVIGFAVGMSGASQDTMDVVIGLLILPIMIPYLAVTARRLHDFNNSGWMQLIFIPGWFADELLGTGWVIWWITFIFFAVYVSQNPTKGKNRFGLNTRK